MKKLLLTALCGAVAMVASAATFTYTHTFAAGEVKAEGGAVALSGVDWTAAAATYIGFDTSDFKKGLQIGSKKTRRQLDHLYFRIRQRECDQSRARIRHSIRRKG